jgi:hypothetical protein|tara:strand:- start:5939 stop:6559 length:621 start_codon:yes stop_codon:yes gene_type:complete
MALANFSDLKTSIASWLNRDDLTTSIPDFIKMAEAEASRRLRVRSQVVRADATVDAQYVSLPSDFLSIESFYLKTSPVRRLEFASVDEIAKKKSEGFSTSGTPLYFTIIGTTAELLPSPSQSFTAELVYYARIPALTDSATSNWLLDNHPDIYLYGALLQSAPYLLDDERIPVWSGVYEKAINQLELSSDKEKFTGGVLKQRVRRL